MFKSGFVSIIGRPNVGKSTFLNYVLGQKISIVSPKAQTTRNQITGIYTTKDAQIIFIDTPGIHKPKNALGKVMNDYSISTLRDVDEIMWIIDGTQNFGEGDKFVIELLKKTNNKVYLVVNKMDLINDKKRLSNNIDNFVKSYDFADVFYISAKEGTNVDKVLNTLSNSLEEGPMYYPEDQITNNPQSFVIAELIREKVLLLTKEEVPHSIAVVIEAMNRDEKGLLNINAAIIVVRHSQKKIIIGNQGKMIKEIGTLARKDIVMLLGEKIYLEIWVKVEEGWRDKQFLLNQYGYSKDLY
jgi:GTP-binding protein Era